MWESLEAVQRAVDRLYEDVTVDIAGDHQAQVRVERQDLDEMLGNLVENAAKYGGGRVFVTVEPKGGMVDIVIEDDGPGIPAGRPRLAVHARRPARHDRQARHRPWPGHRPRRRRNLRRPIPLEESEDLGGLLARLTLPAG